MKRSLAIVGFMSLLGAGGVYLGAGAMLASSSGCGNSGGGGGGGGGGGSSDVVGPGHGDFHMYAVNSILLPQTNKDYAVDLNGDGRVDNQMGNIIGTLATQNLDAQSGVDDSVAKGSVVVLMSVQTQDATLKSDTPVGVTFYLGKSFNSMVAGDGGTCTGCPDFMSGTGMFTVDATAAPAAGWPEFWGALASGKFDANNPVTTTHPVSVSIKVALIAGAPALTLTLNGAHVSFTAGTDAKSGKPGLIDGRLQGSIKNSDVQGLIIPAVASLLTMRIQADPNSSTSKQIDGIFDTGGCTNQDGSAAKAMDNKIDPCEVASNSIIQAVLAPDIQVYDASGNYAPNKACTTAACKDSLSIAVGFTAVQAQFAKP